MSQVKILIVEDSAIIAQNIAAMLEDQEFDVVSIASSGEEAISAAMTSCPDLILMDVTLKGGMDGIETAVHIRQKIDVPIIYSTGSTDYNTLTRAKHTEPHGYLVKPFTDIELYTAIEMALYKHKMERQLKESEARLANILDTAADAIVTIDENHIIQTFNRGAEQIFGYQNKEAIGHPVEILLPSEAKKSHRQRINNFNLSANGLQPMRAQHLEVLGRRKNGTEFPVGVSVSKTKQNGEVFFTAIARDITDRIAAEEALRQSEEKNRSLLDAIPDMMFRMHRDGTYIDYKSPGNNNLLYPSPETFLGKRIEDIMSPELAKQTMHYIQQTLATNTIQLFEYDLPIQEDLYNFEARFVVSGQDEVLIIVRDITQRKQAIKTMQQSEEKLSAIYQFARELTLVRQESVIAEQVLTMASDLLHTQFGAIALAQEKTETLVYKYIQTNHSIHTSDKQFSLHENKSLGVVVINNRQALNISDTTTDPHYVALSTLHNKSALCVPMISGEQIIGVFEIEHEQKNFFKDADLQLLQVLADHTAVALKNAQLQEEARQRERELTALNKASYALASSLNLDTILDQLMVEIKTLFGAEAASVLLLDPDSNELVFSVVASPKSETLIGMRVNISQGVAGYVAREGQPIVVNHAQQDPRFYQEVDKASGMTTDTILAAPLLIKGKVTGVVEVINETGGLFTEHSLGVLASLANSAAISIENAQLYTQTEQHNRELQRLYQASGALLSDSPRDIKKLGQTIVEIILHEFDQTNSNLILVEPNSNNLLRIAAAGPQAATWCDVQLTIDGPGLIPSAIRSHQLMNIDDVQSHPEYLSTWSEARSEMIIPLKIGTDIVGVLDLQSALPTAFDKEDERLLSMFAERAALALENTRLFTETKRSARDLALINKAGQALVSSLDLDTVLNQIMVEVKMILHAEVASIILKDTTKDALYFAAVASEDSASLMGTRLLPNKGIAGWVVREQKPLLMLDVQSDPRFYSAIDDATGLTTRSLLAVPLLFNNISLGVIEVLSSSTNTFNQHDLELLAALASSAAVAIANAHSYESERQAHNISETLRAANFALTQTLDLNKIFDNLLYYLNHLVAFDSGNIMLFQGDSHLIVRAETGYAQWSKSVNTISEQVYDLQMVENLQNLVTMDQGMIIADTHEYEPWIVTPGADHVRSWMGIPLIAGGTVIGLYSLDKVEPNYFTDEHRLLAESLAAQAAIAIQNALLREAEQEQYRQLQRSQAQLVQMEKMGALGRLIASIAHEINNPLQAVQGCLTLTKEELDGGKRRDKIDLYLNIVEKEIERIATILQRMRDFYRPAKSEIKLIDIHTVLQSVLELSSKQLQQSDIIVDLDLEETLPQFMSNPDHLKQVFLNLLLNAVDAMPNGGKLQIITMVSQLQKPDDPEVISAVCIKFCDTGLGMSAETLAHLFEPFFTDKETGTGLGLSVSYGLIEAMDGQIIAHSELNVGSIFTVLLPLTSGAY